MNESRLNKEQLTEQIAITIFGDMLQIKTTKYLKDGMLKKPNAKETAKETYTYAAMLAEVIINNRENQY